LFVNVKDHGATGDGVTDDTSAIHAARNAAGVDGTVYFPQGTYVAKNLAANVSGQEWRLDQGATVKHKSGAVSGDKMIQVTAAGVTINGGEWDLTNVYSSEWWVICASGVDGVTFKNMRVVCPSSWTGMSGPSGIDAAELSVEHCKVYNGTIWLGVYTGTKYGLSVTNCLVDNRSMPVAQVHGGIYIRAENASFTEGSILSDNTVLRPITTTENQGEGIGQWRSKSGVVSGNTVQGGILAISCPNCQGLTVTGNVVRGFLQYGIEVPGCSNTTVSGNEIDGANLAVGHTAIGVEGGSSANVTITGNTIVNMVGSGSKGIQSGTGGQSTTGVTVTGNSFKMNAPSGAAWWIQGPMTNCTFTGNTVDMSSQTNTKVIEQLDGAVSGLTVSANTLTNVSTGLSLYSTVANIYDHITVAGNTLKGVTSLRTKNFSGGAAFGTNVSFVGNNDNTRDGVVTRVKAGIPVDADFDAPKSGLIAVDTTNRRLYVRVGATWRYAPLT
jgi:hypothetical protein